MDERYPIIENADPSMVNVRQRPHAPAIAADQRVLWLAMRQALLMVVDAIEVYLQLENRTSELRRRAK